MLRRIFYIVRPLIPRQVQIWLRQQRSRIIRQRTGDRWPINPRADWVPPSWPGWPDGKDFAFVITHDVEKELGQSRCLDLMGLDARFGFRSTFFFVPERYENDPAVHQALRDQGFEVAIHGLLHDGKLLATRKGFEERARRINTYLRSWGAVGFRAPSMIHDLEQFSQLDVEYDASTYDTDPFEPQDCGQGSLFPYILEAPNGRSFVELPYTLPQDHNLFVVQQHQDIRVWRDKLAWVVQRGGLAMFIAHPDYIDFDGSNPHGYPKARIEEFLGHVSTEYAGRYWNPTARELAAYVREHAQAASAEIRRHVAEQAQTRLCPSCQALFTGK